VVGANITAEGFKLKRKIAGRDSESRIGKLMKNEGRKSGKVEVSQGLRKRWG